MYLPFCSVSICSGFKGEKLQFWEMLLHNALVIKCVRVLVPCVLPTVAKMETCSYFYNSKISMLWFYFKNMHLNNNAQNSRD